MGNVVKMYLLKLCLIVKYCVCTHYYGNKIGSFSIKHRNVYFSPFFLLLLSVIISCASVTVFVLFAGINKACKLWTCLSRKVKINIVLNSRRQRLDAVECAQLTTGRGMHCVHVSLQFYALTFLQATFKSSVWLICGLWVLILTGTHSRRSAIHL